MYVFPLFRSDEPSMSSQMFPHIFDTDQSIDIFVSELNHLCYDQYVLRMRSVNKVGFQIPFVHYVFRLVAILLCIFVLKIIFLKYVNVKTSGLFLFLFEDIVFHTAPNRCVIKINNKNLKDGSNSLMKRYSSFRFMEVVGSQGSPNY